MKKRTSLSLIAVLFGAALALLWTAGVQGTEVTIFSKTDTLNKQIQLSTGNLVRDLIPETVYLPCVFRNFVPCETVRVSVASDGTQGNDWSSELSGISADGSYVAIGSAADNLVSDDSNGFRDIFVHNLHTRQTERVSVATNGTQANEDVLWPDISGDGRYVTFHSRASSLVNGDTNDWWDVFVHDRHTGETRRVSVSSNGAQGNKGSGNTAISGDNHYVAFSSIAPTWWVGIPMIRGIYSSTTCRQARQASSRRPLMVSREMGIQICLLSHQMGAMWPIHQ